jgi:hypothetical protein
MIYNAEDSEDDALYPRIKFHVSAADCGGQRTVFGVRY